MIDILLVSVNHNNEPSQTLIGENLGILYLEASLKKRGYICSIIDGTAYDLSFEHMAKEILHNLPSLFIGFSVFINNTKNTIKMIKHVRNSCFKGHITIGGMWPSFKYREILTQVKEIDSICVGEGEEVISELAECISEGKNLSNIIGLAGRSKDNTIVFTRRTLQDNIDLFPIPDRRGYYFDIIKNKQKIDIIFSRGCHMSCSFCTISAYIKLCGGNRWRTRKPENVAEEMEYLINTTGIKLFFFVDDNFPGHRDREKCFSLSEEIIKRKLNLQFIITSRVKGVEYELFKKLKEAGLIHVNLGVESWISEQLKRYNKKVTPEENMKALEILDSLNISYSCYIIPLDPYVTREEVKINLDMIGKAGLDHILRVQFSHKLVLNQYEPIFKKCLEDNLVKNFSSDDINNYALEYHQFHEDVNGIIDAGDEIFNLYIKIMSKLNITGKEKQLPVNQWNLLKDKIENLLKKNFYKYFRQYVNNGNHENGIEFIRSKMGHVYENICSFTEKITKEDMMELKAHIVDIDGIKISTRPDGFNELVSNIIEKIRRKEVKENVKGKY